ncbi:MAG: acyl-CoA dehydrogenase family protein [Planctomycetes bacterium]|jgi:alkylation response protein AidB-like acyl-CoA dehydrogenase|nr:acyl-CoA dehydrogenase family protein [Planctomycetota bacterium]
MIYLKEEHELIRQTVREFALKEVEPGELERDEKEEFPVDLIAKMRELGLLGIPFPEEYGGAGLDNLSYVIAVEELARISGSLALTLAAHVSLGTSPIYEFGTEEQRRKYVPRLASGEMLGSFGLTEPNAGSDAQGTQTAAVRDGDSWVINGQKIYVTNGGYAGSIIFTAVTQHEPRQISAFIVDAGTPGLVLGKKEVKLGCRSSDTRVLHFEDCRIPAENLVGGPSELGKGFKFFMKTLDGGRISIGAMALGIAQGAIDKAVPFVKERKQFGKPVGAFQGVSHRIADMETEVQAARHMIYHSAWLKDQHRPLEHHSAMAKLFASEVAMRATFSAIQVLGACGYMKEYHVERYMRDAKLCEIGEGTSEIQRLVISRQLLGRLD